MTDASLEFKCKKKSACVSDSRQTLLGMHNDKLKYFQDLQEVILPQKISEIKRVQKEIDSLKNEKGVFLHLAKLKDNVKKLQNEVDVIKSRKEEEDYILNTYNILEKYEQDKVAPKKKEETSILSFFASKKKTNNITSYMNVEEFTNSKNELMNEYKKQIGIQVIDNTPVIDKYCEKCKVKRHIDYRLMDIICPQCGNSEKYMDNIVRSYKESLELDHIPKFAYKRVNHFNEVMSQFQGKEKTEIPKEVYEELRAEIKKSRLSVDRLNRDIVRGILKKIGRNKYYEHIPFILNSLTNLPPPTIDQKTENMLRMMFLELQGPFEDHRPKKRKNFLSYNYILHKLCELVELDHLLICFPLLKDRDKLYQQDIIFKKICKDLDWEFYPSV